uniref:RIN4 pathogenic type III effector avirulence factor Avr cleavage site domain-containing protein n=1 Tax=Kalanchoe fedtschenkoi TaxID=63787 RepID=A0A7N0V0D0_KALFE
MDKEKSNAPWLSVPQFGDWDQKGGIPDYSMDFSKIREMRKQNKREVSRASLGNEDEFVPSTSNATASSKKQTDKSEDNINPFHKDTSATAKGGFMRYFNCCVKA